MPLIQQMRLLGKDVESIEEIEQDRTVKRFVEFMISNGALDRLAYELEGIPEEGWGEMPSITLDKFLGAEA